MSRFIKLSGSKKYAIVDDADYVYLSQWKWNLDNCGYARRGIKVSGKNVTVRMHRQVNGTPDGFFTDHINHNKLDNRKSNLRTVTNSQNKANEPLRANNTSGFKGVTRHTSTGKWMARIKIDRRYRYIGLFNDEKSAANAYDMVARNIFGEYAFTNRLIKKHANRTRRPAGITTVDVGEHV